MEKDYFKLFEDIVTYIENSENGQVIYSDNTQNENENNNLDTTDERVYNILNIESRVNAFGFAMYTTIRPIRILVAADQDMDIETGKINSIQISFYLQTHWEEDQSYENSFKYHYFVKGTEDFKFEKVEEFYNNLLNELPYNNFSLISEDLKNFMEEVSK